MKNEDNDDSFGCCLKMVGEDAVLMGNEVVLLDEWGYLMRGIVSHPHATSISVAGTNIAMGGAGGFRVYDMSRWR
eukprot:CAMPEP_0172512562 /NCGR_PEP_ID=MMETSP1066-20121228/245634_1 /TAXON_ID=671091 /ORGANISM="Coscinodiscus wailesii, Strain CCMP2513" /LENGTH=74 /DNA_ID=CAMNT_0013292445 /DNA_START=1 /DNA_END=221 /DNA_ORIENTATION=+